MGKIIIRPNPLPPFRVLYDLPKGTWLVCNVGPRGSGKSHEASKFAITSVLSLQKRIALLRDEQSTIGQSIMHEVKMRFSEINEKSDNYFRDLWDMQEIALKNKRTGIAHIFSKGFKTSNKGQKANLKSISDVDIALIEEFEDITDEEKFNTFADSIRKEGAIILINSNVPSKNHWFVKRYYNLIDYVHTDPLDEDYKGYYYLIPKASQGVVYITSNYKTNPYLPANTVARYEAYGDKNSVLYNPHHFLTDILGLVSEGAKGRIYTGWKPITNALFNAIPFPSYYGLDFGYSNDPVALVEIKSHNNRNFWRELIYEPGLLDDQLIAKMIAKGVPKNALIYADPHEAKSIDYLKGKGWNIQEVDAGPGSINFGIKFIKKSENFYTEDSKNLILENQEYRWSLDANKEPTDTAEDKNNHLKDAGRYAITTYKGPQRIIVSNGETQLPTKKQNKLDYLK